MSSRSRWVACTTVLRGPSTPASYSTWAGVRPYAARLSAFSAGCSDRCACTGAPNACDQPITSCIWLGGTARTEWMAAPARACGLSIPRESAPRPAARSAHRAASPSPNLQLHVPQRLRGAVPAQARRQVAGVEQRDPQPGVRRGPQQDPPHLVGVGVRRAARAVVQVVELADAGDPGQRHLGVDGAGEGVVAAGVQRGGEPVHPRPPRPERALVGLHRAAESPVEGVRVGVGQAGQGQPGQQMRAGRARLSRATPGVTAVKRSPGGLDQDVALYPAAGQPGELRVPAPGPARVVRVGSAWPARIRRGGRPVARPGRAARARTGPARRRRGRGERARHARVPSSRGRRRRHRDPHAAARPRPSPPSRIPRRRASSPPSPGRWSGPVRAWPRPGPCRPPRRPGRRGWTGRCRRRRRGGR